MLWLSLAGVYLERLTLAICVQSVTGWQVHDLGHGEATD